MLPDTYCIKGSACHRGLNQRCHCSERLAHQRCRDTEEGWCVSHGDWVANKKLLQSQVQGERVRPINKH
jgi:hypothetical protein